MHILRDIRVSVRYVSNMIYVINFKLEHVF